MRLKTTELFWKIHRGGGNNSSKSSELGMFLNAQSKAELWHIMKRGRRRTLRLQAMMTQHRVLCYILITISLNVVS